MDRSPFDRLLCVGVVLWCQAAMAALESCGYGLPSKVLVWATWSGRFQAAPPELPLPCLSPSLAQRGRGFKGVGCNVDAL